MYCRSAQPLDYAVRWRMAARRPTEVRHYAIIDRLAYGTTPADLIWLTLEDCMSAFSRSFSLPDRL